MNQMWLNVNIFSIEKLLASFARKCFNDVGEFTATVIALAGIALSILVSEHA